MLAKCNFKGKDQKEQWVHPDATLVLLFSAAPPGLLFFCSGGVSQVQTPNQLGLSKHTHFLKQPYVCLAAQVSSFFRALLLPFMSTKLQCGYPRASDLPGNPVGSGGTPAQAVQLSRETGAEKQVQTKGLQRAGRKLAFLDSFNKYRP